MQQKEAGGGRAAMGRNGLQKQLIRQFYRGNIPAFVLAVAAALAAGSLNIILSWIIQQLIDAASGIPGAHSLAELAKISGGLVALCVALSLLKYAAQPRFIARAMRQYKEFAFRKLMDKSVFSFRDESTAAYLSALTNDAGSIETDFLSQQLSVITKLVTFLGALGMMLWYSPLKRTSMPLMRLMTAAPPPMLSPRMLVIDPVSSVTSISTVLGCSHGSLGAGTKENSSPAFFARSKDSRMRRSSVAMPSRPATRALSVPCPW